MCDILARAAKTLADLAVTSARQVWSGSIPEPLLVACCGGVWTAGTHLNKPFAAALAERLPHAVARPSIFPPVVGALLLAMASATHDLPSETVERLKGRGWGA